MDVLYEACRISCERRIKEFEQETTEIHKFSKQHQRAMHNICDKIKYPYFSKRIIIAIAAALIALLITTSVFAIVKHKDYIIKSFSTHSVYSVLSTDDSKEFENIKIKYLPDGLTKYEENITPLSHQIRYTNEDFYLQIQKYQLGADISFDTEELTYEEMEINGIKYILYSSTENTTGVIWNNDNYEYLVLGNIKKDEIIKTVMSIE